MWTCVDCDAPTSGVFSRCSDCQTEVEETPNWRKPRPGARRVARCGHEVATHPGQQREACDECFGSTPARPGSVSCVGCDAVIPVASTGKIPKYCSARCRTWVNNHPGVPTPPLEKCGHCDKPLNRAGKKYCSLRCGEIARGARLAEPLSKRNCALPECGKEFQPKHRKQRCCCERHGKILCNRDGRAAGRRWSQGKPETRRRNLRAKTQRRRAAIRGGRQIERFTDLEIFERDHWRCGICHRRVNEALSYPHPRSASLDHVVPLSEDPDGHTRANVRCSHLSCNVKRSNRGGGEQLALVG